MLYFLALAGISGIAFPDLIRQLMAGYYFPYTNSCTVGKLAGINIHLHLIIFLAGFLVLYALGSRIFPAATHPQSRSIALVVPSAGLALLVFVITLQTINHTQVFANERQRFSGKSTADKQRFIHKTPYEFAQYCRRQFPGRHQGFLRTDRDIHNEPFATQHRKLAYFLYPDIDIRSSAGERTYDCLIFYEEKNGAQALPPGFRIKAMLDDQHFLAVKDETP